MRKILFILLLLTMTGTVMAAHCVRDASAIDTALGKINVSDDLKVQVEQLKSEGLELHNNGDHRGAERKLAEGMRILLENVSDTQTMEHQCCMGNMGNMGGMQGMQGMEGMEGMEGMGGMQCGSCGGNMHTE